MNPPAPVAPNTPAAFVRLEVLFRHVAPTPQGRYLWELVLQYRKEACE